MTALVLMTKDVTADGSKLRQKLIRSGTCLETSRLTFDGRLNRGRSSIMRTAPQQVKTRRIARMGHELHVGMIAMAAVFAWGIIAFLASEYWN